MPIMSLSDHKRESRAWFNRIGADESKKFEPSIGPYGDLRFIIRP